MMGESLARIGITAKKHTLSLASMASSSHEVKFVLVPGIQVGSHDCQDGAQLRPPDGVGGRACLVLTLGIVARHKLEQLVE